MEIVWYFRHNVSEGWQVAPMKEMCGTLLANKSFCGGGIIIETLENIANWNSQRNPLEHVVGGGSISPTLVARGQDNNAMMVLYSPDIEQETNMRKRYMNECRHVAQIEGNFEMANRVYDTEGLCPTIRTIQGGGLEPKVLTHYRVRKLTPKECWRLMGFDDRAFAKAEKEVSNSQLYKQAGNSIVVDVLMAILKPIVKGDML